MIKYVIETVNLTKKYKNQIAVDSVNMKVEKGKIYGLLGKNGAGKTTTMCMLLNLANPHDGEIYIFGEDYKKNPKKTYKKIGAIIETPGFYENLTGFENLKLFSTLRGNYDKQAILEALHIVSLDMEEDKLFKEYSLGMKQRLAIAESIVHGPELLILDEPINGLDPVGIKEIRQLLKRLVDYYGLTILISSHILSEIEAIADVIGIMDEGKLIEEISMETLHEKINKYVDFEVSDSNKACKILENVGLKENKDYQIKENKLIRLLSHLDLRSKINEAFVKSGISVSKQNLNEESLEEYFTNLIGEKILG